MSQLLEQPPHSHQQHVLTRGENKHQTFDQFHIHHNATAQPAILLRVMCAHVESRACEDRCLGIATQRFLRTVFQ